MRQQHLDVLLQLLANPERVMQFLHQLIFLGSQLLWVLRVDGREVA